MASTWTVTTKKKTTTQDQQTQPAAQTYTPGQSVTDAQARMNELLAQDPGEYKQSKSVTDAQAALNKELQGQPGAYEQSQDVKNAKLAMNDAQQAKPAGYTPSEEVMNAQAALQNLQNNKPQGYTSKYQPQLEALLQQIQNPGQFKYEFNGDNLFKMYADQYTQRGKQASLDAMGQAAALTGGYGNSYAQQVANQAYDQNLTQLYDRGMELYDRAYQKYLDELQGKYNQYNLLANADEADYAKYRDTVGDYLTERNYLTDLYNTLYGRDYNAYRDTVGDWQTDRNYMTDLYNTERNYDYNQYRDVVGDWQDRRDFAAGRYDTERGFDYNQYRDSVSDWMAKLNNATNLYNTERNFDYNQYMDALNYAEQQRQFDEQMEENIRQFDESLDWDKMSNDQKYAAQYAMQILANGQMPSEEMLRQAGLSAEDAQKMMAQIVAAGGGGGSKKQQIYIQGSDGKYYKANENGDLILDKNGKATGVTEDKLPENAATHEKPTMNAVNQLSAQKTASETYKAGNAFKNVADLMNMYYGDNKKKKGD